MNNGNVKVNFYNRRTVRSPETNDPFEIQSFEIDGVHSGYIINRADKIRCLRSVVFFDGNGDRDFEWPAMLASVQKYVCEVAKRRAQSSE